MDDFLRELTVICNKYHRYLKGCMEEDDTTIQVLDNSDGISSDNDVHIVFNPVSKKYEIEKF